MQQFVKFTANIQEYLRRSWTGFRDLYKESLENISSQDTIEDITRTLKKKLADAPIYEKDINIFKNRINNNKIRSEKIVKELRIATDISIKLRNETVDVLSQFRPLLDEAANTLDRLNEYLKEIRSMKELPSVIDNRIIELHRQMDMLYESVALGLTAESLAHEINNITDQLARRSKAVKIYLDKRNITDRTILIFIEYIKSATIALQKQMSFLSPTLRYVREKRHEIIVEDFIDELVEYYKERMENNFISLKISNNDDAPFEIKINKGKLIQVVDNLVLNSEYWLKENMKPEKVKKGVIRFEIMSPYLQIYDDGRGIDRSVENTLFEPFISTKSNGRGLGLFIVKQLLDSEGCNIELLPERNKRNQLFKFQIDLRGVIDE
jgi:signal transduction histidine kinase